MILRDESEAHAPPSQERGGTGFFPLSVPNQVAAQGVAWSFLLIRDRLEQKSLGTPSAGRGTHILCISDAVAVVNRVHLDPPAPCPASLQPTVGTWQLYLCDNTRAGGKLWTQRTQTSTSQKDAQTHHFLSPNTESKSPLTQQSHV